MRWKLYYGDGSTFSDEDGSWSDAPSLNVQALVIEHPAVGYEMVEGSSGWLQNYIWWPEAIHPWGVDRYGTLDYLVAVGALDLGETLASLSLEDLLSAGVKLGRSIDSKRFWEIQKAAAADTYFPTKSARTRKERDDRAP